VFYAYIYVSNNAGVPILLLSKILSSHLFCGSRTCQFEMSLLHHIHTKYREKLIIQPKELIPAPLEDEEPRKLKRFKPTELATRFS